MSVQWIHGSTLYRRTVVEVLQVGTFRRGLPPLPLGWRARIVIGDVVIITDTIHSTQSEAERTVVDACNELFSRED